MPLKQGLRIVKEWSDPLLWTPNSRVKAQKKEPIVGRTSKYPAKFRREAVASPRAALVH